ncbi:MAG: phenylalanine--tRNA ligase subunit alpha [Bacteroidota bacterium]
MLKKIERIRLEMAHETLSSRAETEEFRVRYLGSKGLLKELYQELKSVAAEEKRDIGQAINQLKQAIEERLEAAELSDETVKKEGALNDLTRPGSTELLGSLHPLRLVTQEIVSIFERIGFTPSEGPEIEDDWHNFSALNFPPDHPARDMQDTFFLEAPFEQLALRTHTSSVQVRVMESSSMPVRTISAGRVYRNEAISARAHCFFHQIEGLYIDEKVTMADLKQTLDYFAKTLFGSEVQIRLRPSYFPFTEPSAEVDVSCTLCLGAGCNVCKYTGWLEILGCGMVDPNVLNACGIDSNKYTGFAFGMGVERIAQLKYRVTDLRLYSENDLRFLHQFHM